MMLFGSLPIIFWTLVFSILLTREADWRAAFLTASLLCGLAVTAITEIAGLFHVLAFPVLLGCWGLLALISLLIFVYLRKNNVQFLTSRVPLPLQLMLGAVAAIAVITGIIAAIAPPNNWDSMTYHMGRVMHWLQNRSVDHYPTHIIRQVEMNPWAEYMILHFQILTRTDYFANFVQWFSMVGSVVGVSAIAKELGAEQRGQIFASVFAATLPMGILQSTGTQNDYVVAFWLVCFVYFGLLFLQKQTFVHTVLAGTSLGLAFLTKATAYIYAFPFFCWIFSPFVKNDKLLVIKRAGVALAIAVIINFAFYYRNVATFNAPLHSSANVTNQTFGVSALISNVIRNISLHLGTRSDRINRWTEAAVESAHRYVLGMNINDPRTTFGLDFSVYRMNQHEDLSGNLLHVVLIGISLLLFLSRDDLRNIRLLPVYTAALVFAFVLFCFYLKWQPWNSRLHLPLFVLWSPFVGTVFSCLHMRNLANAAMFFLLVASLPWVLRNASRPLLGGNSILTHSRTDMYFTNRPVLRQPYYQIASAITASACRNVGLKMESDDWEYPLWVLLQWESVDLRVEHVDVNNESSKVLHPDFKPCVIVDTQKMQAAFINPVADHRL